MAKFKFKELVTADGYITTKINDAVTDADVGKPVKLYASAPDTYALCADGDTIDGFIVGIDPATADGKPLATIQIKGRKRCEASGATTIGAFVEAGAVAAAGTAEANGLPLVSTHTVAAGSPLWRVISGDTATGTVADGDTAVIIERI